MKIADLAIFSLGIKNTKGGAKSEADFSVVKNIQGVKLRARATGELITKSLNLEASLMKATANTNSHSETTGGGGNSGGNSGESSEGGPVNP